LDRLIAAHRQALTEARKQHRGPVILAGKSMGSRVGCHVSLEEPVDALVCLGYPLRGQSGALRDEVLKQLKAPVLFVQGSKDPLCPLLELDRVRPHMVASNELYVVDGGNHSLEVGKRELSARNDTQPAVEARALTAIQAFLERTLG
jgi:predicted alpha/beta-hydrolase family hydrolase